MSNYTQMPQAQVFLNNTCNLSCHFCMNKYVKDDSYNYQYPDLIDNSKKRVGETKEIIKAIDFLILCGVTRIELGTTIGEPLQHPFSELERIFNYIESREEIEYYFFYTNLTSLTEQHVELFSRSKKFNIKISCYGTSKKQFLVQTQQDRYLQFIKNLKLLTNIKRDQKMKVLLAFRAPIKTIVERAGVERMKKILLDCDDIQASFEQTSEHFDWKRTINHKEPNSRIKPNTHTTGHCGMILTDCGILSNGDFTMCAWLDLYGDNVVGNINVNTVDEIMSAREDVIKKQNDSVFESTCKYCSLYTPTIGINTSSPGGFNGH